MNKSIIFSLIIILFSCKSQENRVVVEQIKTEKPILLRLSSKTKDIKKIEIPFEFKFKSKKSSEAYFSYLSYYDSQTLKNLPSLIYKNQNDSLIKERKDVYKKIPYSKFDNYILYTQYDLDSLHKISLNKYVGTENNKGEIKIDNVSAFKADEKELLEKLIKNDSIFVRYKIDGEIMNLSLPVKNF